jgi:two-component system, chemotaxis family, chemotaxis protein CheY
MENPLVQKMKKVLIVDDSTVIRKAIAKFLERYSINIVGTASNGTDALKLFTEHKPDIVTLDITMPGFDGFHVLDKMIKLDDTVKIIVITALSDKATGLRALKKGAKSYLNKPFGPEKLQEAFDRLI